MKWIKDKIIHPTNACNQMHIHTQLHKWNMQVDYRQTCAITKREGCWGSMFPLKREGGENQKTLIVT